MVMTALFSRKSPGGVFTIQDMAEHPGVVRFVSSTHAAAVNALDGGQNPDKPLATVAYALTNAASLTPALAAGDVIYVMPGHVETIAAAAGWAAATAGIAIIGLGRGSNKPTITFSTDPLADINVTAANILIKNLRLVGNIDSLVNFLDLDADWFFGEDLDFVTSSTFEALGFINLATTKDHFYFKRLTALQPTDPAGTDGAVDTGFLFCIDSENIVVEDSTFYGNFETAIFHNRTTACKNLWVRNCYGIQSLSGAEPFQLVAAANGAMVGGGMITPAEAAATEATLVGTIGDGFFVLAPSGFGNDGLAGGQGGIIVATAS